MFAARGGTTRRGWWRSVGGALAALLIVSFISGPLGVASVHATEPETTQAETVSADQDATDLEPAEQRIENVIAAARQYLGVAYRLGTEGPSLFDCSGLMFRIFSDASLVDRISGNRLRAAGYMRWFARQGLMTANEEDAQRGDLVIYDGGKHIGIYLGDGRTISALLTGVTVHALHGISQDVTGFLRPDWSGEGKVAPFVPVELPEVIEEPAVLVPTQDWTPQLAEVAPIEREGVERVDLRTPSTRTFENRDGTFTTEFHAQPIHYTSPDTGELLPIDLAFTVNEKTKAASVSRSPVAIVARSADHAHGLLSAAAAERTVTLRPQAQDTSGALPILGADGRVVDYFDLLAKGVGLRVLATADGFASFLVLGRDPDRNRFTFELDAPGLTAALDELGNVLLADEEGLTVGVIPRPLLLDSSDSDGSGGGLYGAATSLELEVVADTTLLTIVVRPRFLEEAAYPAYLDLSLVGFPASAPAADIAIASSRHADAAVGGFARPEAEGDFDMWFGRQPRTKNEAQAFLRFDELAQTLGVVDVASASLEVLPYLQQADDVAALVSRAGGEWAANTLTWNTRPLLGEQIGSPTGEAGQWFSLDVSDYATDILSRGATDTGLVLHGEEGAAGTWKRIAVGDHGPRLVVTWSGLRPSALVEDPAFDPEAPEQLAPDSPDTEAPPQPVFAWSLPTIAAAQTRLQLQLSTDGFTTIDLDTGRLRGKAGRTAAWTLPEDALTEPGDYEWRVRVRLEGGDGWSQWSAPGSFTLEAPAVGEVIVPENLPAV